MRILTSSHSFLKSLSHPHPCPSLVSVLSSPSFSTSVSFSPCPGLFVVLFSSSSSSSPPRRRHLLLFVVVVVLAFSVVLVIASSWVSSPPCHSLVVLLVLCFSSHCRYRSHP